MLLVEVEPVLEHLVEAMTHQEMLCLLEQQSELLYLIEFLSIHFF